MFKRRASAAALCLILAAASAVRHAPLELRRSIPAAANAKISMEAEEEENKSVQNGIVSRHSKTYSPAQCERELKALHERYPDQTELSRIGTSVLGQPIWALSFGAAAETAKTRVLVQAGMHGREWINVQIAMAQIEDYLGQERYAALLRETALVFVPMCNPDGVRIAQEGADWIEDEAARADVQRWIDESGEPYDQWKANGRGVDLNRNFDARWDEQTEERATAGPAYAFYRGENPESEPETQALVELTNDFGPDSTISYHSRGEYVYWYFGQTGEALDRDETLALRIRDLTGYACLTRENADVDSFAGYKDWCVEKLGIPAFTIENGANEWGVPVPIEHFDEIYRCSRDITALVARELNR